MESKTALELLKCMLIKVTLIFWIISLASCSNDEYEFQIENNSNYEISRMMLGNVEDLMIDANSSSRIIIHEKGALQEGISVFVAEFKHMSPDSTKVYNNSYGKFYTFSAFECSELNVIEVKVNFSKQTINENDFIELEIIN